MRPEGPTPAEARGFALKHEVRKQLQTRATDIASLSPNGALFLDTFARHIDELGINWSSLQTNNPAILIDSMYASMQYANRKIGGGLSEFFTTPQEKSLWEEFQKVIDHPDGRRIFHENLTRTPITLYPERVISLPYILHHEFGDKPLTGIDLGAGAHAALPLISSATLPTEDFPGKKELEHLAHPVAMKLGVGVDIQQADTDPDWIRAFSVRLDAPPEDHEKFDHLMETILSLKDPKKFPFLTGDMREKTILSALKDRLREKGEPTVDFVLTSFSMHQVFSDLQEFTAYHKKIAELLSEGGLWINIGEELIAGQDPYNPSVKVYGKENDEMKDKGKPFILKPGGLSIASVDLAYFATSSQR